MDIHSFSAVGVAVEVSPGETEGGLGTDIKAVGGPLPAALPDRRTFATLAIPVGENINWVARMLRHQSPVVTLERYNRYVPNLTREDGKLLAGTSAMGKRFPTSEII